MKTQQLIQFLLSILAMFASSNPLVADVEQFVPAIMTAISNAKVGQAFSVVDIPLAVDGKPGHFNFGWTPN